jgi:predicted ArsR family transcriptional regulator
MALERDGLVLQQGTIKGFRKPHYIYGLSAAARDLFPRPYGILFNRLLSSLKGARSRAAFVKSLRDVGSSIGAERRAHPECSKSDRVTRRLRSVREGERPYRDPKLRLPVLRSRGGASGGV